MSLKKNLVCNILPLQMQCQVGSPSFINRIGHHLNAKKDNVIISML